jgi:predicted aspartyl protease
VIVGTVTSAGVPTVQLDVGGRMWDAVVDTGFNGDLELPGALQAVSKAKYLAKVISVLAAGQSVAEDLYEVDFPFDGQTVSVEVTFVAQDVILIGTGMLRKHRLEIDFPRGTVRLERTG